LVGRIKIEKVKISEVSKLTKNQKKVQSLVEEGKSYSLLEASKLVKEITTTKFDASVDIDVRLGVDPRKANQMVRGIAVLPHGTGKSVRVLVLCTPDKEAEAKAAGADFVGLDDYITKIEGGWTDVDIIITMPSVMAKVGKLGRILGPRNLMPNPKSGTVTNDIGKAVTDVKGGKIDFKVDKTGIIHTSIGKVSFSPDKIHDNAVEILQTLSKLKPSSAKGTYFKSIHLSSTMSKGIQIEAKSVSGI
jgi:large subunit ribosomal protein L1